MELKFILEALLFSAQKPLSVKELREVFASAVEQGHQFYAVVNHSTKFADIEAGPLVSDDGFDCLALRIGDARHGTPRSTTGKDATASGCALRCLCVRNTPSGYIQPHPQGRFIAPGNYPDGY